MCMHGDIHPRIPLFIYFLIILHLSKAMIPSHQWKLNLNFFKKHLTICLNLYFSISISRCTICSNIKVLYASNLETAQDSPKAKIKSHQS